MGKAIHKRHMKISGGGGGCLTRLVVTVLVIAAILLVTGWFLARTEGARSLVQDKVSEYLDTKVEIGRMRIGLPRYDLVMENLKSTPGEDSRKAGFAAREVRVGLGLQPRWHIRVFRLDVDLVQAEDGSWLPACIEKLGPLPWQGRDPAALSRATADLRDRVHVRIEDGAIEWSDATERSLAEAGGITFEMMPVRVRRRLLFYYYMEFDKFLLPDGSRMRAGEWEWLATDESGYVELHRPQAADSAVVPPVEVGTDDRQTSSE